MKTTKTRPYWHGMLCADTHDEIVERMRDVLDGEYFTLVCCNSYDENSDRFTSVDVYPSQRLKSPVRNYSDETQPGIGWCTTRLSMGVHTTAKTQAEARDGRPHDYTHFTFKPREVVIDLYAPAGYRLRWIFSIERHDAEED